MPISLTFKKAGREIKTAIGVRIDALTSRLERRNRSLEEFMNDRTRVRSYLVRMSYADFRHGGNMTATLLGKNDISSEEKQEIAQVCRRIHEIEQEIHQLSLIRSHLDDEQIFDLSYQDLVAYGFEQEAGLSQDDE